MSLLPTQATHPVIVPLTALSENLAPGITRAHTIPSLSDFIHAVMNGDAKQLVGVYVLGVMAYPIVQQAGTDAGYVSTLPATITQFRMASQYHSIGLLAHDYLAGVSFKDLKLKDEIVLVFGDGALSYYQVDDIQRYQALAPESPYSSFIDLHSNATLSAEQLFNRTYGQGKSALIFQTCISTPQVSSWGRLFVVARPVDASRPSLMQSLPVIQRALQGASLSMQSLQTASILH